jgi:short chain dehydrogenase
MRGHGDEEIRMSDASTGLSNKVAIVTGAGRGIGRERALLFAREGVKIVVNDLADTLQVVARMVRMLLRSYITSRKRDIASARGRFGATPYHCECHCPGLFPSSNDGAHIRKDEAETRTYLARVPLRRLGRAEDIVGV